MKKLYKRFIPFFLSLLIVFCSFPFTSSAFTFREDYPYDIEFVNLPDTQNFLQDAYTNHQLVFLYYDYSTGIYYLVQHYDYFESTGLGNYVVDVNSGYIYLGPTINTIQGYQRNNNYKVYSYNPQSDSSWVTSTTFMGWSDFNGGTRLYNPNIYILVGYVLRNPVLNDDGTYENVYIGRTNSNNAVGFLGGSYKAMPYHVDSNGNFVGNFTNPDTPPEEDNSTSIWNKFKDTLNSIKSAILDLPNKIGEKLNGLSTDIRGWFDSLTNNLRGWFDDVKTNVTNEFTNIKNNLSTWFTNLTNTITTWFSSLTDNLRTWFTNLKDDISGFFEKLWNRIWYGNEEGAEAYQPPTINTKLDDIIDVLDDAQLSLLDAIDTIDDSAESVSTDISHATSFVNGFLGVAGTAFSAFITFGLFFLVARKVVGR